MKEARTAVQRQNDAEAITLIRASSRCFRNEAIIKYFMIVLSFGICLAAIFNKYLPLMASGVEDIEAIQERAATIINLISGGILVAGMPLSFYCSKMHSEGSALRDRYDSYVFDNPPNLSILRPVSHTVISVYSKKIRKPKAEFKNYIYPEDTVVDEATAQYDYISKEAHADYKLYLFIQPFFVTLWVGFCIMIIIIAVSFNDMFVTTLINIMIPSLSAITTIGNSWYACKLQMRQLNNLLTVIDQIEAMPPEKRKAYITEKNNVRLLADGLFGYRSSAFLIPGFLIKRHSKIVAGEETSSASSEMPKLVVPSKGRSESAVSSSVKRSEPASLTHKTEPASLTHKTEPTPAAKSLVPSTVKKTEKAETPVKKSVPEKAETPVKKSLPEKAKPTSSVTHVKVKTMPKTIQVKETTPPPEAKKKPTSTAPKAAVKKTTKPEAVKPAKAETPKPVKSETDKPARKSLKS